ncbi:hypothetical protein J4H86_23945 [Spiractinospora alimapuensis]|uniref:hypothetical protein n=1 Tax=Spiractinospora alimapuensis TaxID=2820884 RepID=UPI001F1ABC5C|nr:hypothetical protein [Spiractinospora alimapuensis]QVQ51782.1 hypothetical protein J4H86_23945 [Spiractinospora alimapuensis]
MGQWNGPIPRNVAVNAFGAQAALGQGTATLGAFVGAVVLYLVGGIWIDHPLGFAVVWTIPTDVVGGLAATWPVFVWALVLAVVPGCVWVARGLTTPFTPREHAVLGLWVSVSSGLFEELRYRWLFLVGTPVFLAVANLVTFGLVEWVYTAGLVPVANVVTLGILEPELTTGGWLLGATIVSVNAGFRKAHAYQGVFGWLNAWFIGMVLFFVLFNHGLVTAVVVHIGYDLVLFTVAAVLSGFRPLGVEDPEVT